jgi:hypothetical protein
MATPDLSAYVDLTLYDADPSDLVAAALVDAQTKLPGWVPREGNTEMVFLQSTGLEVSELIFAINRLPGAIVQALLRLFGIFPSIGLQATATVTFTLGDNAGHTIAAGTRLSLDLGASGVVNFTTDADLVVPVGSTSGTTAVTAGQYASLPNGTAIGTALSLLDQLPFIQTVVLASVPSGGADPEGSSDYLSRGVQTLQRLVSTLVLPGQFASFALTAAAGVYRASALNNWNSAASAGRTFADGVITAGSNVLTSAAGAAFVTGDVGREVIHPDYPPGTVILTRTSATSVTTSQNATASGSGQSVTLGTTGASSNGYIAVAVLGQGGLAVPGATQSALVAQMEAQAQANLGVTVIDPAVTAIDVSYTVHPQTGVSTPQVEANVLAALQAYLSTDTWDWSTVVRINSVATAISKATGVAFIPQGGIQIALRGQSLAAADLTLPGAATLATLGAVTAAVA